MCADAIMLFITSISEFSFPASPSAFVINSSAAIFLKLEIASQNLKVNAAKFLLQLTYHFAKAPKAPSTAGK